MTSVITLIAGAASAGGIAPVVPQEPSVVVVPATPQPVRDGTWTGLYAGGNLAYDAGTYRMNNALYAAEPLPTRLYSEPEGLTGALRFGYDWQIGSLVLGAGAEIGLGSVSDGLNPALGVAADLEYEAAAGKMIFLRAGYAMGKWLPYGLWGYSSTTLTENLVIDGEDSPLDYDIEGQTYGLGTAYRLNDQWSVYGEYTFTDFTKGLRAEGDARFVFQREQVKFGVEYRF